MELFHPISLSNQTLPKFQIKLHKFGTILRMPAEFYRCRNCSRPPYSSIRALSCGRKKQTTERFLLVPFGIGLAQEGPGCRGGAPSPRRRTCHGGGPRDVAGMRCAPREGSGPLSATPSTLVPRAAAPFRRRLSFSVPVACGPRPHAHASGDERRRSEREDGRPKLVLQRDEFYSFEMLFDQVF